uniref:guanine nucleotide exchange factor DBS-like isoform X1 n=1 Tax=Ciona intestinalis TaxID=7719 RepID=UPI00089DAFBE|nr:guanine nucleotide exchange factor DBS-like isoform X1 [Ciona intestinalis]|eukprot:XP_018672660.1 guanine nucleotide exchange factor DBS-like isoform X1 [Ciona intestinalis]
MNLSWKRELLNKQLASIETKGKGQSLILRRAYSENEPDISSNKIDVLRRVNSTGCCSMERNRGHVGSTWSETLSDDVSEDSDTSSRNGEITRDVTDSAISLDDVELGFSLQCSQTKTLSKISTISRNITVPDNMPSLENAEWRLRSFSDVASTELGFFERNFVSWETIDDVDKESGNSKRHESYNPSESSVIFPDEMRSYYDFITACSDVRKHGKLGSNARKDSATFSNSDGYPCTLTAANLRHQLQRCYVYIHGGKDESGCPVICFPHYPSLHEIPDEDFKNTLLYLTQTTRASVADLGFVIVLDRRRDKWSSLRGTLIRLAEHFPGNIRFVFVLRPQGFFQGAISNIGFRWQKDDFSMKVPVEMLTHLDELHQRIHPSDLTKDFQGTFGYDHSMWINNRMLVETFATKATTIITSLEDYGSVLAESELPNDSKSAAVLINFQQIKTNTHKEEILSLEREAKSLRDKISNLNINDVNAVESDLMECYATLISETNLTFENFWLKYKEKMKQCLELRLFEEDYREVCSKLESIQKQIEMKYSSVGITALWMESLISDLTGLEQQSKECLTLCENVQRSGSDLVTVGHYAVDCIQPKTDELSNLSSIINEEVSRLQDSVKSYQTFLTQINEVRQWCEDGMSFLAGQVLEKSLTLDGATSAFDELETRFKNKEKIIGIMNSDASKLCGRVWSSEAEGLSSHVKSRLDEVIQLYKKRRASLKKVTTKHGDRPIQLVEPSKKTTDSPKTSKREVNRENKQNGRGTKRNSRLVITKLEDNQVSSSPPSTRKTQHPKVEKQSENLFLKQQHVMKELVSTERTYITELKSIVEGYGQPIDDLERSDVPVVLQGKSKVLLGNMGDIYDFHGNVFLALLDECMDCPSSVGKCFLDKKENFEIYSEYCQNSIKSEHLRNLVGEQHPFFVQCQKNLGHRLSLSAFLLKPVQRVTKYQLLLQQMLKYSSTHLKELQAAVQAMLEVLKSVNDGMHQVMITGYKGDLTLLGKLHLQGQFTMQVDHKKSRVKSLKRPRFSKLIQRHLFLYDDEVLICKAQTAENLDDEHSKTTNPNISPVAKVKGLQYLYKNSIKMGSAGMSDTIKSDARKFEIWSEGREHVYTLQAPTLTTKQEWVRDLKKVLSSQTKVPFTSAIDITNTQHGIMKRKSSCPPTTVAYVKPKQSENESKNSNKVQVKPKRAASLCVADIKVECSASDFKQLSLDH